MALAYKIDGLQTSPPMIDVYTSNISTTSSPPPSFPLSESGISSTTSTLPSFPHFYISFHLRPSKTWSLKYTFNDINPPKGN